MGQFFKQVFTSCLGSLLGLTLFTSLGAGAIIALMVAIASQETKPSVKDKTMLVLDLSQTITDQPQPASWLESWRGEQTSLSLHQVVRGIEAAQKDSRIVGIFLYGRSESGANGYATLTEVRQSLEKFRQGGKKILAYDLNWTEREYYLASVADTIALNPMGNLEFNGFSTQPLFFREALDKFGIGVQVVRVGSYKGAVEPYTRNNLSPENRAQIQMLVNDLWNNFLKTVAAGRQIEPPKLQAIANQEGILNPASARQAKLIDKAAYFDEMVADIRTLTGETKEKSDGKQSFRQISLENYSQIPSEPAGIGKKPKIAVLYAAGEIVDGAGEGNQIGSDRYSREIRKLRADKDIKAVVIRINSPGGSATASDIILREIYLLDQEKPVIISMGNVAASGGYWLATGGRKIFADANTITGSIGVFGLLLNIQTIANRNGLRWDTVKTGNLADLGTNVRPQAEEELKIFQAFANQTYTLFIDKVAKSRQLTPEKVKTIAQGRVWSGARAKALGLVDWIGGLNQAINYAAAEAKLGNNWHLETYPTPKTFDSALLLRFLQSQMPATANSSLTAQWLSLRKEMEKLSIFNDPNGIYTLLPFTLEIK